MIFSLLETFREPTVELLDYFEEYATFAWIQGDLLAMQEQYREAGQQYALALGGREQNFPVDVKAITRLEEKCTCVREGCRVSMPFWDVWT